MKILKSFGNIALCFLAIISVLITVGYGFYSYFVDDTTIGINNISDQIAVDVKAAEDMSEDEINAFEERWFLEANYYSNSKNNGIELQELNFNYFTSHKLTKADYRSTGMQYVGDYTVYNENHNGNVGSYVSPDFTYYDTTDGVSFNGYSGNLTSSVGTLLNRNEQFIIKIDNRPFTIQLTGSYSTGWWIFKSTFYYTYSDVFENIFNAIETNSAGYGDYYITLDLSHFFSIREMDSNGKYLADNVTDIIKNYSVLKFHYDENGASRSSQSLFGKIENNSVYDSENIEFWQARMVYTLTEKDLTYRYSESYNGYFVSLSNDIKLLFEKMPTTKLILNLDFSSIWTEENEYNVIGFDYDGFEGFYIDTLTVKSAPKTLYVMPDAFKDTTVKTFKYSSGINFDGLVDFDGEVIVL